MKINKQAVDDLQKQNLPKLYKQVIKKAKRSGNAQRIKAAKRLQESIDNLNAFFRFIPELEEKRGYYIIPKQYKELCKKLSVFLKFGGKFADTVSGYKQRGRFEKKELDK